MALQIDRALPVEVEIKSYIPIFVDHNDSVCSILEIIKNIRPHWQPENINLKLFTDGITNKLVCCSYKNGIKSEDRHVLVRIYGNKTDLLIDRKAELRNLKLLHSFNLAPQVYAVFENGLAYEYVPGSTLSVETVKDPKIWPLVAKRMAQMHRVQQNEKFSKEPILWNKINQFLNLLPETFTQKSTQERFENNFGTLAELKTEFQNLKESLDGINSPIVFAHNDLLLGNVIYNQKDDTVTFIDYEYAGYNYQAYDIANHFAEYVGLSDIDYKNYPSKEFQFSWIRVYLAEYRASQVVPEEDVASVQMQIDRFVLAAHFLWAVWALIQAEHSTIDFDFLEFGTVRINEYNRKKNEIQN